MTRRSPPQRIRPLTACSNYNIDRHVVTGYCMLLLLLHAAAAAAAAIERASPYPPLLYEQCGVCVLQTRHRTHTSTGGARMKGEKGTMRL